MGQVKEKKIYIASNEKEPVGLVLANSEDIAWAFFQGRGDGVTHIEEISLDEDIIEEQSLVTLLTSNLVDKQRDQYLIRRWRRGG
jgi:hypothetical protein